MNSLHKAIDLFENVVFRGTDLIMREVNEQGLEIFKVLTKEQFDLLILLSVRGSVSPGYLAKFQGVQKSTMSNRLKKMMDHDYIEYAPTYADDKRYRNVQLTPKGIQTVEEVNATSRKLFEKIFQDFDDSEQLESFVEVLNIINKRIILKGEQS